MSEQTKIKHFGDFGRAKRELIAEFGEQLLSGEPETQANIKRACAPLAKYAKVPVETIVNKLAQQYIENNQ